MISEQLVKSFFENMKMRGVIADVSEYSYFNLIEEKVCIWYSVAGRTSRYKVPKEYILEFLRDWKLKQIIE